VRWFDAVFATYVDQTPAECTLLSECGGYVVVEHDGSVFACDFHVENDWRLGNVQHDDLAALLNSPQQARFGRRKAELARTCQTCRWLKHCRGGCPRERLGGPPATQPSYFCKAYQAFFEHADGRLRALADAWSQRHVRQSARRVPAFAGAHGTNRVGRNASCPCGSGIKYKHCCGP
jgi:uncharacterized protein